MNIVEEVFCGRMAGGEPLLFWQRYATSRRSTATR
jgi:hypothetical protein